MKRKTGLVLAGGGSKGAYEVGAIKALKSLKVEFDVVTGTSIGALNGCMAVQNDYEKLYDLWDNLKAGNIINGAEVLDFNFEEIVNNKNLVISFFKKYINEKGADITPFIKLLSNLYNNEKIQNSSIEFGCVTVSYPDLKPVYVDKKMLNEYGINYLLASASCFPAFPIHQFSDYSYIDGGYYDNLPVNLALSYDVNDLIVIDLNEKPYHENYLNREHIKYIFPKFNLGSFLDFNREVINRNIKYGFNDVYKAYNKYVGYKYTFNYFERPEFFEKFYFDMLKLEIDIGKSINFKDNQYITKYFLNKQYKAVLSVSDLNYGIIDEIMDLLGVKSEEVHDFEIIKKLILKTFEKGFEKDYEILPSLSIEKIKEFFSSLDRIGTITKIINQTLYEEKRVISDEIMYVLNPIDIAVANWIILLKNGN